MVQKSIFVFICEMKLHIITYNFILEIISKIISLFSKLFHFFKLFHYFKIISFSFWTQIIIERLFTCVTAQWDVRNSSRTRNMVSCLSITPGHPFLPSIKARSTISLAMMSITNRRPASKFPKHPSEQYYPYWETVL